MKKLLNKKGITLVEIIVVIAIIAIMTAILIPALSTTSTHEKEARENARAFYSNVQQVLVEEKFKETKFCADGETTNNKFTLIYAVVDYEQTDIRARTTVYIGFTDDEDTSPWYGSNVKFGEDYRLIDTSDGSTDKFREFGYTIQKLLYSNEHSGYYYAVLDNKYRVASTYYSRYADFDKMNDNTFSQENRIKSGNEEFIVGAYPYNLSSQWWNVFVETNTHYD